MDDEADALTARSGLRNLFHLPGVPKMLGYDTYGIVRIPLRFGREKGVVGMCLTVDGRGTNRGQSLSYGEGVHIVCMSSGLTRE